MNDHSRELCTMYTVKLSAPLKMFVFCKFLKIFMISDKTIYKAFKIHKLYQTKPIRDSPPP